jgi:hypothetical protein
MDLRSHANDTRLRLVERRGEPRMRVLLAGKLAYANSTMATDCSIRNLSETGALIVVGDIALPRDPFLVVIKHAFLHEARMAWRRDSKSGLTFISSWRFADGGKGGVVPLRRLWLDLVPR